MVYIRIKKHQFLNENSYCSLRRARAGTHTQVSSRVQFIARTKSLYFDFCFNYYIFLVSGNFSLKHFSLNIICMKFKTWLIIKYFRKICCSLISSNKTLLIITWYGHTFMFALSQTMYLFEANLNLLADTSTPDLERYNWGKSLTASYFCCLSTGLAER